MRKSFLILVLVASVVAGGHKGDMRVPVPDVPADEEWDCVDEPEPEPLRSVHEPPLMEKPRERRKGQSVGGVHRAAFSPDGRYLATYTEPSGGELHNLLQVWDLAKDQSETGERRALVWKRRPFKRNRTRYSADRILSYSPDGRQVLFIGGLDGKEELRKFDAGSGRLIASYPIPGINSASYSAGGSHLLGMMRDERHARLWRTSDGRLEAEVVVGPVVSIAPSPDGSRFLLWRDHDADDATSVKEYDFGTGRFRTLGRAGKNGWRFPEYVPGLDAVLHRRRHRFPTDARTGKPGRKHRAGSNIVLQHRFLADARTGKGRALPEALHAGDWEEKLVFSP
ncbi:MAG: hypothetical protein K2W96_09270, partial [Gemmataceae bacterium]|nr:hypothetical protein [Gemmataceae bacterium]